METFLLAAPALRYPEKREGEERDESTRFWLPFSGNYVKGTSVKIKMESEVERVSAGM